MKNMKKVELIIEAIFVPRLIKLLESHGIGGYTIIKDIEGYGEHGYKAADGVSDISSNHYLFTVCEASIYEKMDPDIRNFLRRYGGRCILTDVMLLLGPPKK